MTKRLGCFVCLLLLAVTSSNASAEPNPVFEAQRGLNFSSWLANAPRQPMFERDFRQVKAAGIDHIRLPFNPEQFGFHFEASEKDPGAKVDFSTLDRALDMALSNELAVILDVHPRSAFMQTLENNDWAERQFVDLWEKIAQRYKKYSASKIAFALLNEPQYYGKESRYARFIDGLAAKVRQAAPKHTIIVSAPHGSSIKGLLSFLPLTDPNIIYDFHFYEPYIISLQGVHTGFPDKMLRYFRKLPYPSELVDRKADTYAPLAPNAAKAETELQEYKNAHWNKAKIIERISIAADWAKQHNVRLFCGEFGVLRNHIDSQSRYRWIGDVRKALEEHDIPWQLWDYADLAGIAKPIGKTSTDPVDGSVRLVNAAQGYRTIEPQALYALGLHGE